MPLLPTFVSFPIPGPILRDNARGSSLDSLVLYIIHLHELRLHEILEREKERNKKREKRQKKTKGRCLLFSTETVGRFAIENRDRERVT